LQEVPSTYRTQINDVLLTALVQAFARWSGTQTLLLDVEGHGREESVATVDLSRTVGWFTTIFPVLVTIETFHPGEALKAIKEQIRQIPNKGIGYGVLRYVSGVTKSGEAEKLGIGSQLSTLPQAEVSFNYLGQFDQTFTAASLLKMTRESSAPSISPRNPRAYLLEIIGRISAGRLQIEWIYSENIHRRETIERLTQEFMEALRTLIEHCQSPETGGYTPSDFPEAGLNQQELDDLLIQLSKMPE
jgi:non-ribosomal peptide synthase protein (TIGR01720 family)